MIDGCEAKRIVGADANLEIALKQSQEVLKEYKLHFALESHTLWEDFQDYDKFYAGQKMKLEKVWIRDGLF